MTWWAILSGGVALLIALLLLGLPVFVAFLILNVVGIIVLFGPAGFGLFANSIFTTATTTALATVPLFIIMGEILFRSGAMEALLDSLDRLVGRIRGRQYVLCILLSAIVGALSGAAMAVAGLFGRTLYPAMAQRGYDKRLAAGTILAGACLGPIIPPSVLAIIIATLAEVSTAGLLIAGILPGLLLTILFLVYVVVRVRLDPSLAPEVAADVAKRAGGSKVMAVARMLPCAIVFFMVMGFIMFGIATPTEAAATGVLGAIIVAFVYRSFSLRMIAQSLASAAVISAGLLLIMCCAVIFSQLLTFTGATRALAEFVAGLDLPGPLMLVAMLLLPFFLFMFLDQLALMLVLIPIYLPLLKHYQFDAIWYWTLFLIVATVGGLTPPFGYVLFALKSAVPQLPTTEIFRASWPFVWLIVLGIAIIAVFPDIATVLPNLSRPR